jgi:trigger factor
MFLQFQGLNEETFKTRTRETAENQIKVDLLIDAVAKAENLKPTDEAIEEEYKQIAEANKVSLEKAKKAVSVEDVVYHMNKQLALEFLKKNNGPAKSTKKEEVKEEVKEEPKAKKAPAKKAPAKKTTTKKAE